MLFFMSFFTYPIKGKEGAFPAYRFEIMQVVFEMYFSIFDLLFFAEKCEILMRWGYVL